MSARSGYTAPPAAAAPRRTYVFVLDSFASGGAQRVALNLIRALDPEVFPTTLVLLDARGPLADLVGDRPQIHNLQAPRLRQALPRLLGVLRQINPRAVLSTLPHLNLALAAARRLLPPDTRLLLREANTPSSSLATQPLPRAFGLAYRLLYRRADRILCPSRWIAEELTRDLGVPADRLRVVPNPVDLESVRAQAESGAPRPPGCRVHLVAAGRFVRQKGFDRLLELLPSTAPDVHLSLCGDGPERPALESLVRARGLERRVQFTGILGSPWPIISGADAFLLPSRWEGMPNVALEALACGTPVIATPEAGGIGEVAEQAAPGAIVLAGAGAPFLDAIAGVRPRPAAASHPSLLPTAYELGNAAGVFAGLLAGDN